MSDDHVTLTLVPIEDLRPTQMTVGFVEVADKRRMLRAKLKDGHGDKLLARHMIPVLLGPKKRSYVVDHHHLARALLEEGVKSVATTIVADLSRLEKDEFWSFADNRNWCHPYTASGERRPFSDIPREIGDLSDDPYRSLAGELRRAGGYAKETVPFTEFLWADFLRRRIEAERVQSDFAGALTKALKLARSSDADHLPGWCGPVGDE